MGSRPSDPDMNHTWVCEVEGRSRGAAKKVENPCGIWLYLHGDMKSVADRFLDQMAETCTN